MRNDEPFVFSGEVYLTVRQACRIAGIGRTTFYKLLDNPHSGLARLAVRIPGLGRIRLPEQKFRSWLESLPVRTQGKCRQKRLEPVE